MPFRRPMAKEDMELSDLDELELNLYARIQEGLYIPSGSNDKNVMNALTRLRRNGFIRNDGTRSIPIWKIER